MEQNSVKVNGQGGGVGLQIRLPIGFRFRPTDEELLLHYLKPKVYSSPFPSSVIPVLHDDIIFHSHPSHLPGDPKEMRHFFCKRKWDAYVKNYSSSRIRITTSDGSGYWKPIGKEKTIHIVAPGLLTPLVGIKKSMVFYQGKPPHGLKTPWIMHEYRLLPPQTTHNSTNRVGVGKLGCLSHKSEEKKIQESWKQQNYWDLEEKVIRPTSDNVMDFMILDSTEFGPPPLDLCPPSPSCSSGRSISFTPYRLREN